MLDIQEQSEYWNKTWKDRIHDNHVEMNKGKYHIVIKQLNSRPYLAPLEKLDIGCGTGIHALKMAEYNPLWRFRWTGIDLSTDAVDISKRFGMNTIYGDIYNFDGAGKKYGVFMFLDSLEHFFDHERLGKKIIELAAKEYIIIGNIPLYSSEHSNECERSIDCVALFKFLAAANCGQRKPELYIYGVGGFPYMFFETSNLDKDYSKWAD